MNDNNIYLVLGVVIALVVLANGLVFLVVRALRPQAGRPHWFQILTESLKQPTRSAHNESMDELSKRVRGLSQPQDEDE